MVTEGDKRHGRVVVVTGGRDYTDRDAVFRVLDALDPAPTMIVHGACGWDAHGPWDPGRLRGADRWADEWATERGVPVTRWPAGWARHGPAAGPRRNRQMLDAERPDLAVAFPGDRGTDGCCREAWRRGIPVHYHDGEGTGRAGRGEQNGGG